MDGLCIYRYRLCIGSELCGIFDSRWGVSCQLRLAYKQHYTLHIEIVFTKTIQD